MLGPPVPWPRHVFGVGLNYRTHAAETGMALPEAPLVFTKFPGCLAGPVGDVALASDTTDYEAELVIVIGAEVKGVAVADAWDAVAGLMIGQDVSDRAPAERRRPAAVQPRQVPRRVRADGPARRRGRPRARPR